jgi:hypothetical protein
MFDAVIFSGPAAEPAARTLSTLVEGVAANFLGRVTVVSLETSDELTALGDAAGCQIIMGESGESLRDSLMKKVATPHVLALRAGVLLPPGWPDMMKAEFAVRGMPDSGIALLFEPEGLQARLRLIVMQMVKGRFPFDHGALVPRGRFIETAFDGSPMKVMGPVQMSRLRVTRMLQS